MSTFPTDVIAAAIAAQKSSGCPAAITLAQWALESAYGHALSAKNNYFGIKWHENCGFPFHVVATREWSKKLGYYVVQAKFIEFPTLEAAFHYHGKLIVSSNPKSPYADAQHFLPKDWHGFMTAMGRHYATDPDYLKKLDQIIKANSLERFNLKT
jgi:flagellum-specific peptidoglycan hydrolase FlgJ